MKFVTASGIIAKARRFLSAPVSIDDGDAANPEKVAKMLRALANRVSELETRVGPEGLEFEVNVGAYGALTSISHNFGSAIRWYVVTWTQIGGYSFPTGPSVLVEDATSDSNTLRLRSYAAGRAIVRVEQSQVGIVPGQTVGAATAPWGLSGACVSGLRLSLSTATPVTSTDVTGATTVYLTPYLSGLIKLYYNSEWATRETAEASLALGTLTSGANYDVFAYWSGSAVTLELSAAWSTDTARADALVYQNGTLVKSADHTRLYVGTLRTTATTTTEDSASKRFLWNMYNRVTRYMSVVEGTASWTYVNPSGTYRQVRAQSTNRVEYVCGEAAQLTARASLGGSNPTGASAISCGIGLGSTTVNSAQIFGTWCNAANHLNADRAHYTGNPGLGYRAINWLETGQLAATYTFFSADAKWSNGLQGEILG